MYENQQIIPTCSIYGDLSLFSGYLVGMEKYDEFGHVRADYKAALYKAGAYEELAGIDEEDLLNRIRCGSITMESEIKRLLYCKKHGSLTKYGLYNLEYLKNKYSENYSGAVYKYNDDIKSEDLSVCPICDGNVRELGSKSKTGSNYYICDSCKNNGSSGYWPTKEAFINAKNE